MYALDDVFAVELNGSDRKISNDERVSGFAGQSFINENASGLSKIDPRILENIQTHTAQVSAKINSGVSDNLIPVFIYLDSKDSISSLNQTIIQGQDDNIVVAILSFDQIQSLSNLDMVEKITMPKLVQPHGHAVSQGVALTDADQMHTAGFTGSGVTIAVIDINFFTTNSEISGNVISSSLFDSGGACGGQMSCGASVGDSHGTAVAEIIVDMAPDVDLRLYTIRNTVDFNNAIDDAVSNNVDIISASLGIDTLAPDGVSGFFRDGTSSTAKKINNAESNGILPVISAGNEATHSYFGTYSASTEVTFGIYQSVMEFQPSETGLQNACLPVIDVGDEFYATWNEWSTTNQDYDLYLFDSTMTTQLANSIRFQAISTLSPEEFLDGTDSGLACLVVASWSSSQNHLLHIYMNDNFVDTSVPNAGRTGSLSTPADASGALTVGAVNQATDIIEAFSSGGPTDDGRLKPEICGSDNTLSHQTTGSPPLHPFFGTSAAAPHVAGAAALLLDQNSSLTNDQLRNKLINEAKFNAVYSVNNVCGSGSGVVSLETAAADTCVPPGSGTWTITASCTMTASATAPGNVLVQNNSVLTVPSGITLDINFGSFNLTVKSGSGVLIESGGTIT